MLPIVNVQCPHCGAEGQVILPPVASVVVGTCPSCKDSVVVFCGRVLPLDHAVMTEGPIEERREHVLAVITDFLRERLQESLDDEPVNEDTADEYNGFEEPVKPVVAVEEPISSVTDRQLTRRAISQDELDGFVKKDLEFLDNAEYFRSVFHDS